MKASLLLLVLAVGCAATPTPEPARDGDAASEPETAQEEDVTTADPGEPFRLRVGERARVAGDDLAVAFVEVAGDSRCPKNVNCFWAGDAEVVLQLARGGEEATVRLHTHGGARYPQEASALGATLRLEELDPYPETEGKIAAEAYEATLVLKA